MFDPVNIVICLNTNNNTKTIKYYFLLSRLKNIKIMYWGY
jgi:hypothetical protein